MLWLAVSAANADVYLVTDVAVDVTAENSVQARAQAFEEARLKAARRLMDRLTTQQDRNAAGGVAMNSQIASRLAAAVDVQDEKQSATRYVGLLAVKFDERAVKSFLNVYDMPYVDTQAGLALIVPEADETVSWEEWALNWQGRADKNVLSPYVTTTQVFLDPVTWEDVSEEVLAIGAQRAVIARLSATETGFFVQLFEMHGETESRLPIGATGPFETMADARKSSVGYLEAAWKNQTIVRAIGETAVQAVASYQNSTGWVTIERALKNSRLVKNYQVENISLKGADLSFAFSGRPDQLSAELRANGVRLSAGDFGWVLEPVDF